MRRRACLAALLLAPCVAAGQAPTARPVQQVPAGFVAEAVDGMSRMQTYYPGGQGAAGWRQRIQTTLLAVRGVSPATLLMRLADRWAAGCPGAAVAPVRPSAAGPHPGALVELDCGLAPGGKTPEHSLVRAVANGNTVFLADYTFHYEPDAAERDRAMAYLMSIGLQR